MVRTSPLRICLIVLTLSVQMVVAPSPVAAAAGLCSTGGAGHFHTGQRITPGGLVKGTSALIDFYSEHLCDPSSGTNHSFSSSWVALTPNPSLAGIEDIFQVGMIKCGVQGCPAGTVHTWAYGHSDGACGIAVAPTAQYGSTHSGWSTTYKISYRFASDLGQLAYEAYVGSTRVTWRPDEALESCWRDGPRAYHFKNETGNTNDQTGGEGSPHQHWTSLKYANATNVWSNVAGTCTVRSPSSTAMCSNTASGIDTWDNRWP